MHPVLKTGVALGTYSFAGDDTQYYCVRNARGEEFDISRPVFDALQQADGTHPLKVPDHVLQSLKTHDLVTTSRFVFNGVINQYMLFFLGARAKRSKCICRVLNAMLPVLSLSMFGLAVFLALWDVLPVIYEIDWWLYYGLIFLSVALHEFGHGAAGIAYDYDMSDVGILLLGVLPIGAYVAHVENRKATTAQRVQMALAGVEWNLLLAGAFMLLTLVFWEDSFILMMVANTNVLLAIANLLPAAGLDGEHALSALLGIRSLRKAAKKCLSSKKERIRLWNSGLPGRTCLGIFLLSYVAQVILILWMGSEILMAAMSVVKTMIA